MASVANAFDLLKGAGEQVASKANKKKKSKPKPKAAPEPAEAASEAVVPEQDEEVLQAEACAVLEKSARTFNSGSDRVKLWKDWIRQAGDRSPKASKYRAEDGNLIQFKELVLRSRALEITVESCVTSPLTPEQANSLQQLLSTFLPRVDASALASSIARLAQLLAEDTQSFDTTGAAQRAVHNVVASLKVAKADAEAPASKPVSLYDRLLGIDREANKQHGFLASVEKLAADPAKRVNQQSSGISKAHIDSAKELVRLYGDKFDLLQPNSTAGQAKQRDTSSASQATIRSLEEVKQLISNHLKEARKLEESVKGAAMSADAQRAQAVAALRREEAVLAQQAAEIAGQVRVLESQLAQLKGQAAEVEDKRVRLQQQQAKALEALGASTGRKLPGLSAQHYHEELAASEQLLRLVDPSRTAEAGDQLAAAQEEHSTTAQDYMSSVRNLLQMSSSSLADVPNKVVFCRQRIAQAEKLSSLGAGGKDKSTKTHQEAEKLLGETVRHCEEMMSGAQAALEGMRSRFPAFTMEQQTALSQAAYEIEDMMSHIRGQYELAMAAVRGQAPVPALPGATAAGAAGAVGGPSSAGAAVGSLGAPAFLAAPAGAVPRPAGGLGPIMPPAAAALSSGGSLAGRNRVET
eukprot:gene8625-8806_t